MGAHQLLYIPAGSLKISKEQSRLDDESWDLKELRTWHALVWNEALAHHITPDVSRSDRHLPPEIQVALLKAPIFRNLAKLFHARWIALDFSITSNEHATLRVHLLPDDVLRGAVDRSDVALQKSRQYIIDNLDYSDSAWKGLPATETTSTPALYSPSQTGADTDMSLLELFNQIPPPQPNPDAVYDDYSKDSMRDILDSKIPGLSSVLHPYQRRSAALMLQKEVQPGSILDPRLIHVRDQQGSGWYVDMVAGTVLKEPRFYDGISGGILAEEMGTGKTIMCLALILATKNLPTIPPSIYNGGQALVRRRIGSLADMAASCATRHAVPWKSYFDICKTRFDLDYSRCMEAIERNPGFYLVPAPEPCRAQRRPSAHVRPPSTVYLSNASLIIVPSNLVVQWKQEIQKHTNGLSVLVVVKDEDVLPPEQLLDYDIILFSQSCFERIGAQGGQSFENLADLHFKRCIVDEGHKLGNSKIGAKSNLLLMLNFLKVSSRWIVTGTPSHGLFGVDQQGSDGTPSKANGTVPQSQGKSPAHENTAKMERKDLERIGSMAALYLKARPWANTSLEPGDTVANWNVYLMLPKHNAKSRGRWDCLKSTLDSLIIRHQQTEVGDLLPPVEEKITVLQGSYQDQLSLNVFSMILLFNAIQSQRTDQDYFFHPRQRKNLLQVVHNLKQASFFGASFFTPEEIKTSVETAEQFLQEKKIAITEEDETLLKQAIGYGHAAMGNRLRNLSNQFHEMPVCVKGFPAGAGQSWSLDGDADAGDTVCTSAHLLLALQKLVSKTAGHPEELNSLLNGSLIQEGIAEREKLLTSQMPEGESETNNTKTLAGNTKIGQDSPRKSRSHGVNGVTPKDSIAADALSGPLKATRITSTVSAKLSYLVDGIVKYQDEEKIIVFYENENVAWYLASMLDVLQIQYLIYARSLTTKRKAQYVNTFHHNPVFRVLLMDLSQAAFGLDMRAASRIYFISPVLNPQVEAQAIGRVRRISQQKPVSVETLVLKGSIDEVLLERKTHMTQAEHRQIKSILDIRPIYNWIKSARFVPMPDISDVESQMIALRTPQDLFGRGFGKAVSPDDGLVLGELPSSALELLREGRSPDPKNSLKRTHMAGPGSEADVMSTGIEQQDLVARPARRVRFVGVSGDG